jgi:tRNA threonylcarbamoyladenosine biosynthesis protein TsaE
MAPAESQTIEIALPDQAATARLAAGLAPHGRRGDVIALEGDLGAGKTTFARAFLEALGVAEEVPSPTFSLVQLYETPALEVWHFDLYRLTEPDEVWELGFEEARAAGLALVEWPERLGPHLPADRLHLVFAHDGAGRRVSLAAHGDWAGRPLGLS